MWSQNALIVVVGLIYVKVVEVAAGVVAVSFPYKDILYCLKESQRLPVHPIIGGDF